MTERDQFEEVAELHGLDTRMLGESRAYMAQTTRVGWALWQESRKQALEEVLVACEKLGDHEQDMGRDKEANGCDLCVGAIQSLATKDRTLKKETQK